MDADRDYENKKARDAIQTIETIQSMIDVSADRLEGLRTQCSTSAELTQQEIRTLEGKLVKHFSRQLVIKASFGEELHRELRNVPSLAQWLRVVGLSPEAIETACSQVASLEALRERTDREMKVLLASARDEEVLRLCRAMHRLRTFIEALGRGEGVEGSGCELPLYWDSWERHARASPRARVPRRNHANHNHDNHTDHSTPQPRKASNPSAVCTGGSKSPTTPVGRRKQAGSRLPTPAATPTPGAPLIKSRSHESQLSVRPDDKDLSDNSQSSTMNPSEATPPASPRVPDLDTTPLHRPSPHPHFYANNAVNPVGGAPRSPRTPTVSRCMAHDIAHRFTKTFNMIATCDYCDKQMLFGPGLKCKECKFKCHKDCESKVPPSCGLPPEFVMAFREKFHKDGGGYYGCVSPVTGRGSSGGILSSFTHRPWRRHHAPPTIHHAGGPDSSSNTSSCNSSTPSSPAPPPAPRTLKHKQQFNFPEVKPIVSSPNHTGSIPSPARVFHDKEDLTSSIKSADSSRVSISGSNSTDSSGARQDSLDLHNKHADARWPRQNSLSMKEWDIPYDELKLFEVIGTGRFGTVYRGSWHGAVAVKLLHVHSLQDDFVPLDTFKHEVATFRKTRHENLVLFMGACMKPPRLAIVTALCKGMTLYTHIHLRKDKFTANKSVIVAQQISQGMGYLHARGIVHKDLKTKNIFLENGKVVITDFGLFSVTKLCFGNNARGDSLGIPAGWLCYLAPELCRALSPLASLHLPFSKCTDVYAFGTVWYELLCGEYPFKGQPPEAVIWQVGKGVKQSLANMQASRDIKDILMVCWALNPSDRPDFPHLLTTLEKLPRKRLARSPSHPVHLSRSADSVF